MVINGGGIGTVNSSEKKEQQEYRRIDCHVRES